MSKKDLDAFEEGVVTVVGNTWFLCLPGQYQGDLEGNLLVPINEVTSVEKLCQSPMGEFIRIYRRGGDYVEVVLKRTPETYKRLYKLFGFRDRAKETDPTPSIDHPKASVLKLV